MLMVKVVVVVVAVAAGRRSCHGTCLLLLQDARQDSPQNNLQLFSWFQDNISNPRVASHTVCGRNTNLKANIDFSLA